MRFCRVSIVTGSASLTVGRADQEDGDESGRTSANPPSAAAKTATRSARRKNLSEYVRALDFIPCEKPNTVGSTQDSVSASPLNGPAGPYIKKVKTVDFI